MAGSEPSVRAVVVTRKRESEVVNRLCYPLENGYLVDRTCLIDNGSRDGAPGRLAAQFEGEPGIEILWNEVHFGDARVSGFGIPRARHANSALLVNDDAKRCLETRGLLIPSLEGHRWAGIAMPQILLALNLTVVWRGSSRVLWLKVSAINPERGRRVSQTPRKERCVWHAAGWVPLVQAVLFERLSVLDQQVFLYGEAIDVCPRVRTVGMCILDVPRRMPLHRAVRSEPRLACPFDAPYIVRGRAVLICTHAVSAKGVYGLAVHLLAHTGLLDLWPAPFGEGREALRRRLRVLLAGLRKGSGSMSEDSRGKGADA